MHKAEGGNPLPPASDIFPALKLLTIIYERYLYD